MLNNRYLVSLGIPIVLLLAGSLAKKLTRGSGWRREDFYLGVEFTLAALSSSLMYIVDLGSATRDRAVDVAKFASAGVFSIFTFVLLLIVLSFHQDWTLPERRGRAQLMVLVIFCNFLGFGVLAAFILMVKGA